MTETAVDRKPAKALAQAAGVIDRLATPRWALAMLALISAGALVTAFVLQWGFGVKPCILCLYGRIPYALVAVIAGSGALLSAAPRLHSRILLICAAVFAAGSLLAVYHVGVEYHWWASIAGCAIDTLPTFSAEDLQASALTPSKPCDEVDFRWLGLSLAGWNIVISVGLAGLALAAARRGGAAGRDGQGGKGMGA